MPVEFFDHTADVGARVVARSVDELFAEAAVALTSTITEASHVVGRSSWSVALRAPDLDLLLVDWLSELIALFDVDGRLACAASVRVVRVEDGYQLDGTVQGEAFDPARHPLRVAVKGMTYHRLCVEQGDDRQWRATFVFDI